MREDKVMCEKRNYSTVEKNIIFSFYFYLVWGDVCIGWKGKHSHHLPNLIQLSTLCLAEVLPCMSDTHRHINRVGITF